MKFQTLLLRLLVPICMNFIPHAKGKISTVLQGSQLIFSALSVALAGHFYQGSFQSIGIIISILLLWRLLFIFWLSRITTL